MVELSSGVSIEVLAAENSGRAETQICTSFWTPFRVVKQIKDRCTWSIINAEDNSGGGCMSKFEMRTVSTPRGFTELAQVGSGATTNSASK